MAKTLTTNYALGNWEDGDNPGADDLNENWQTIDEQVWNRELEILSLDADIQLDLNALAADFASQRNATFNARMQRDSSTQISLQRYAGSRVSVNGEILILDSSGLTCTTSHTLINATGGDSGSLPASGQQYNVYVSNNSATYAPRSLRMSTTAPTSYNGIKYLAASGNGANWRFVGWVVVGGVPPTFFDSETARLVINYYNRRDLLLYNAPGYVDDNAATTFTESTGNWKEINGGTNSFVEFIGNDEDPVRITASVTWRTTDIAVDYLLIGIGRSSASSPTKESDAMYLNGGNKVSGTITVSDVYVPATGYRYADLLVKPTATTTLTIFADNARNGASADPVCTFITGTVRG